MNKAIVIKVLMNDFKNVGQFKELYRNTIFLDDCLETPFPLLINSLKILYPKAEKIEFCVQL